MQRIATFLLCQVPAYKELRAVCMAPIKHEPALDGMRILYPNLLTPTWFINCYDPNQAKILEQEELKIMFGFRIALAVQRKEIQCVCVTESVTRQYYAGLITWELMLKVPRAAWGNFVFLSARDLDHIVPIQREVDAASGSGYMMASHDLAALRASFKQFS